MNAGLIVEVIEAMAQADAYILREVPPGTAGKVESMAKLRLSVIRLKREMNYIKIEVNDGK